VGLVPDELRANGAGLHTEPPTDDRLEDEDGLLVIPAADTPVSDDLVQTMRDADQR
jgi:hypothetical protein